MIEIKERSKITVKIYGSEYEMRMPTLNELSGMQEKLRGDEARSLKIFAEFLESQGLPKKVVDDLQVEHATLIVEHLCGSKKN
jgi:hypothetical protein